MGRRRKSYGVAGAALMLLLLAPRAVAQEGNPRVIPFGGGSSLKRERSFTVGGDAKRTSFARGGKFRVRGKVDLTSHWAVEGASSYGRNNLRVFDLGTTTRERAFGTRVHQVVDNPLYLFAGSKSNFRPFLTAGAGLIRYSPTDKARGAPAINFSDKPATISRSSNTQFSYGRGVETKVGRWFGLRLDLRDHVSGIPRFGVPRTPAAGVTDFFSVSGSVHDVEASAGFVIYLQH